MTTESLNGRFEADGTVEQAWRTTSIEEPSPQIDAAIIAAARAETAKTRRAPGPVTALRARRIGDWWPDMRSLAAAAAVAGLAFVLVQTIPRDRDVAPPVSLERARPQAPVTPQAEPEEPPSIAESAAESPQVGEVAGAADSALSAVPETPPLPPVGREPTAAAAPTPAPVPDAPLAAPNESRADIPAAAAGQASEAATDRSANFEGRVRPSAKAAPASAEARAAEPWPAAELWAARIETLHAAGDLDAAARELREFRAAYGREDADRRLPETLRSWASSVE